MIPFTQFVYPDGRRKPEWIDRPPEIERLAEQLIKSGYSFEIECRPDSQTVFMECLKGDDALSNRLCVNGPKVPEMVDEMVREAYVALTLL